MDVNVFYFFLGLGLGSILGVALVLLYILVKVSRL